MTSIYIKRLFAENGHSHSPVDQSTVDRILQSWPDEPTVIARRLIDRYGIPDDAAAGELFWYDCGPWKRTELYRDGVAHECPVDHQDYLKQVIDYEVPAEKIDALECFDGSIYVDRTNGELASKCDRESMNVLAINLAVDVIMDRTSLEDARVDYAISAARAMMGETPAYAREFMFDRTTHPEKETYGPVDRTDYLPPADAAAGVSN